MRDLPRGLLLLSYFQKTLCLLEGLLGGCIFPLRGDQRVVVSGHSHGQPALRDFDPGRGQRFSSLRPPIAAFVKEVWIDVLMDDSPGAVDMDAVVRHKPAAWQLAVSLRA